MVVRPSSSRGRANSSWLRSWLSFSFGPYSSSAYDGLHSLRVLNEDRIAAGGGFDTHGHAEFEIFSYIVSGQLKHQDSLGHSEVLGRGAVQFTSAGTGLSHSEVNACTSSQEAKDKGEGEPGGGMVHLLQVWVAPNTPGLKPAYATKKWSDKAKTGRLCLILSKDGGAGKDRCIKIHQDVSVYASILPPGSSVFPELKPGRTMYVHLVQDALGMDKEALRTGLSITDASDSGQPTKLSGGDAVRIEHQAKTPQRFCITGAGSEGASAEFLLFDIAAPEKKKGNNKGGGKGKNK